MIYLINMNNLWYNCRQVLNLGRNISFGLFALFVAVKPLDLIRLIRNTYSNQSQFRFLEQTPPLVSLISLTYTTGKDSPSGIYRSSISLSLSASTRSFQLYHKGGRVGTSSHKAYLTANFLSSPGMRKRSSGSANLPKMNLHKTCLSSGGSK